MTKYQTPIAKYISVVFSNGKLAFKFDPDRGLIEIQERGQREVFDLAQIAKSIEVTRERQATEQQ